jgi:predicted branched-subunit amino acid permease
MLFSPRFRQGAKAAIPIWIAFVPSSLAWGIAAQAHGFHLGEVILMSAWVYSGPAQFAVLAPIAAEKSSLQILLAASLMNLRFLPMSTALAPYFRGVRLWRLLPAAHFIVASSFVIPYLRFRQEFESRGGATTDQAPIDGQNNLSFFLGVGITSFLVWVVGTGVGHEVAQGLPGGFEEGLKFILPGYFAGLLVIDMRGRVLPLICLATLVATIPATLLSPDWGWIATAIVVATVGWSLEQWMKRA